MGLFSSGTATRDRKTERERAEAEATAAIAAHEVPAWDRNPQWRKEISA